MLLKFNKYQGAGNDFVMIDGRKIQESLFNPHIINNLCDRHFGIGADGLILLLDSKLYDFRMKYFNADGYEGTMCGNGGRCIVKFASSLKVINKKGVFEGIDGVHHATILDDNRVKLKMTDVEYIERFEDGVLINTGSPHFIMEVEDLEELDVFSKGREIRYQSRFGERGANINFVNIGESIKIRTYERGVEDETLACGTGVVAGAIYSYFTRKTDKNSLILKARGGDLKVDFTPAYNDTFKEVWLTGDAQFVFDGKIEI